MKKQQAGFTLIEMMVALLIGMVIVGAVLASYVSVGRNSRAQSAWAELNENAQIALLLMTRDLQMAGYSQPVGVSGSGTDNAIIARPYADRAVFGCAWGLVSNNNRKQTAPWDATVCAAANGVENHVIEISYEADLATTSPTGTGVPSDCIGSAVPSNTLDVGAGDASSSLTYYLTRNRYYLATAANTKTGQTELYCASNQGGSGQPLVDGVEQMKFWYGEATSAEPRRIVRYVTADGVSDWGRVLSVRVCVLLRSENDALGADDPLNYLDCDGVERSADDRHPRRVYFTTATLRNKMAF
jgi:type IV pilus assembly protein PilW